MFIVREVNANNLGAAICGSFISNFYCPGLSSISIGVDYDRNPFFILLGVFQFIGFYTFFVLLFIFSGFLHYYFIFAALLQFLNINYNTVCQFCMFNPDRFERVEEMEKSIIVIHLNIIFAGYGSLLYGLSNLCTKKKYSNCWNTYKYILYGIIQNCGFSLLLVFINNYKDNKYLVLYIIEGLLCYCFSIYSGFKLYCEIVNNKFCCACSKTNFESN